MFRKIKFLLFGNRPADESLHTLIQPECSQLLSPIEQLRQNDKNDNIQLRGDYNSYEPETHDKWNNETSLYQEGSIPKLKDVQKELVLGLNKCKIYIQTQLVDMDPLFECTTSSLRNPQDLYRSDDNNKSSVHKSKPSKLAPTINYDDEEEPSNGQKSACEMDETSWRCNIHSSLTSCSMMLALIWDLVVFCQS